jgi:hypothetical protein
VPGDPREESARRKVASGLHEGDLERDEALIARPPCKLVDHLLLDSAAQHPTAEQETVEPLHAT